MTDPDMIEPLSADLAELFERERAVRIEDAKTEVLARVELAAGLASLGASVRSNLPSPSDVPADTASATASALGGGLSSKLAALLAVLAFAAGVAVGGIAFRDHPSGPLPLPVPFANDLAVGPADATLAPSSATVGSPLETVSPTSTSSVSAPMRSAAPPESARKSPADPVEKTELGRERELIDAAQTALSRGRPNDALFAIERHASAFPSGSLIEEREALRVRALLAAGREAEARERAAHFEKRFPQSVLGPRVRGAVNQSASDAGAGPAK